jgi:uncharacterized membrane protein YoaK (UPF0700 family)
MCVVDQYRQAEKCAIAVLLTFAAGCVDIVGYLSAYHTFTAHMTGNTVHLGNSLLGRDLKEAGLAAMVLVAFVLGSLGGRALIEIGTRKKIRTIASWTLGIEAVLLAFVAAQILGGFSGPAPRYPKIALTILAAAMGLQTATITRVGALTVHTTFVTGMINKLCQLVSQALFDTYDISTASPATIRKHREHRKHTLWGASFIFSIWCSYVAGAGAGTLLQSKWQLRSLYLPVGLLCLGIIADQTLPLSVEEERDQRGRHLMRKTINDFPKRARS